MSKYTILYNSKSNKDRGNKTAAKLAETLNSTDIVFQDITEIENFYDFMQTVPEDRKIVFTGGDGTINHVVNDLSGHGIHREVFFFPGGSGNDFLRDIGKSNDCEPFPINEYLEGLPTVVVKGLSLKFVNGIGVGLDGYACEESARMKEAGRETTYAFTAMKGLMYGYKPIDAEITVDGETRKYHKVWMAPTMFGAYFGGGFRIAPRQSRKNEAGTVTSVVFHNIERATALGKFAMVKAGKGEKLKRYSDYRVGHHVIVKFSEPTAFQIDGEVISDVSGYEVKSADFISKNEA